MYGRQGHRGVTTREVPVRAGESTDRGREAHEGAHVEASYGRGEGSEEGGDQHLLESQDRQGQNPSQTRQARPKVEGSPHHQQSRPAHYIGPETHDPTLAGQSGRHSVGDLVGPRQDNGGWRDAATMWDIRPR